MSEPKSIRQRIEKHRNRFLRAVDAGEPDVAEFFRSSYSARLMDAWAEGLLVPADEVQPRTDAAVAEAVERERERCAKVAERGHCTASGCDTHTDWHSNLCPRGIAAAIRQPTQEAPTREPETKP